MNAIAEDSALNFEVEKMPIFAGKDPAINVIGKCALVRTDTRKVLGVVGENFGLVQNQELFPALDDEIFDSVDLSMRGDASIKDHTAFDGSVCYREYIFPKIMPSPNSPKDLGFLLTVTNGFGGSSLKIGSGAIDFYCQNGSVFASKQHSYMRRHSANLNLLGVKDAVESSIYTYKQKTTIFGEWMRKQVTDGQVSDFLTAKTTKGLGKKLMRQYRHEREERGATVWALYSALTNWSSHTGAGPFATRDTGMDHEAYTRMGRKMEVARITNSDEFLALAA